MRTFDTQQPTQRLINLSVLAVALVGLYFTAKVNYLLFHTLAEVFSIVVAFSLFIIAWNAKQYIKNPYLLFIGIAYLFVSCLDLLHTLSYKGMPIFTDYDYYANQLWIGARYLEAISLLLAFVFLRRKTMPNANLIFAAFAAITAILILSIFTWKIFPVCFVGGAGLTPFKKVSEYIICGILTLALVLLRKNRNEFEPGIYTSLFWSIVCTIVSELAFSVYVSNYDLSNMVGHYFKIFSFLLIYAAIIQTGMRRPFELIFRELDLANSALKEEIEARKQIQRENEMLIDQLKKALEEIKTLEGILPICIHCKKIRDDQGYWNQLEKYIHEHSGAQFSHGLCPDCLATHYPEVADKMRQSAQAALP